MKSSNKISLLKNFSLVFASMSLFFLLMEVVLRLFGFGNLIIYEPDPKLFWKPKPNQNCYTKFEHKPIHVNAKRTRGEAFSASKPKNVFRIISLGDSKTFGWGLSDSETYSEVLAELLQKYVGSTLNIEVINTGVNAWSYAQMHVYLRDIGLNYDPDMVILADANLWSQFSEHKSKEFVNDFMQRVRLKNLLRRSATYHFFIEVKLQKFYYRYRKKFIPIDPESDEFFKGQQSQNPHLIFKKSIENICQLLNHQKIRGLIIDIPNEKEIKYGNGSEGSEILSIKKELSQTYNIPLIDFREYFSNRPIKLYLEGDSVHPNVEGNRIIAHCIFDLIKKEFKDLSK